MPLFCVTEPLRAPKTYYMDGVILYERGLNQIKTQVAKMMEKRKPQRRVRRGSFHQSEATPRGGDTPTSQAPPLRPFLSVMKADDEGDQDLKPTGTTTGET